MSQYTLTRWSVMIAEPKGLPELECQTGGWSVSLASGLKKKIDAFITCPESRNWRCMEDI
jgi:hypothetical protein